MKFHFNHFLILPGIIATFVGTVIGAGFASGREIYQFFSIYGLQGFLGIFLAVICLGIAGAKVYQMGVLLQPRSYEELLEYLLGKNLAKVADVLLALFFLILIGVMFAGTGSIFVMFKLGFWNGVVLTSLILIFVLWKGLSGLISANLLIIPLMFICTLMISIFGIIKGDRTNLVLISDGVNWIIGALQFAAYNLVLAIPVLLALAKRYPNPKILHLGSWLGALLLGCMAFLVNVVILCHFSAIRASPMPVLEIAKLMGGWGFFIYGLVLWGEIFSTLLANVYGLTERLVSLTGLPSRFLMLILVISGIFLAQLGFSELIAFFYPLFGWVCFVIILMLCLKNPAKHSL